MEILEKEFEDILNNLQHKNTVKSTTTLKFKKDVIDILLNNPFEGDILEVGTSSGNTTVILAAVAKKLNKKVFGFDNSKKLLNDTDKLCKSFGLDNYILIRKDVYKEEWNVSNIGFVLIDCVHTEWHFRKDLHNAISVSANGKPIIVAHDFGLVTKDGDTINNLIKYTKDINIVRFIGEFDNWNELGSGTVIDWEGVQVEFLFKNNK